MVGMELCGIEWQKRNRIACKPATIVKMAAILTAATNNA